MTCAILYCRVSTEEQGYSLRNQEERLRKYSDDHEIEILETYREDHSTKSFDRPVFQRQLLPFVKKNRRQIDHLLVLKWDRFSRDTTDALVWIREFQSWGIQVDATEQRVDLSVPQNKYMLAFYLTHPEVENDIRAANTREGMSKALREGRWVSKPSIGYRMERDATGKPTLMTDDQAPFVREAFQRIATGQYSYTEVYNQLTERGFRGKRNQFFRMLGWYPYCGLIPVTDQSGRQDFVRGVHEPIVSEDLFHRVQAIRHERRNGAKHKKTKLRPEFPLRGHLACQHCGNLLTASISEGRSGRRYAYYHCHHGCKQRFRAEPTNDGVVAYLGSFEIDPGIAELYQTVIHGLFEERSKDRLQEISIT
jgi:DNA invertase Pin-like site-specific DNA recombinase